MPVIVDYCTLAELKDQLRITDAVDDVKLASCIVSASRVVDQLANRTFGTAGAPVARVFTPAWGLYLDGRPAVQVDPFTSTVGLEVKLDRDGDGTYETTLTAADFDVWPFDASQTGQPFTHLVSKPNYVNALEYGYNTIQVTATWGYGAVPDAVKQATLLQAARFFVRRDSPYGQSGSPTTPTATLLDMVDPDVVLLLAPYKAHWGAV